LISTVSRLRRKMMQVARTGTRGAAQHAVLFISITILSAPRTVEATSYPYVGCLGPPSGWARPGGDVAISAAGAEHCRTICKDLGYTYFAMECPRGSIVHCQCNNALSGTSIPDNYCEGTGNPLIRSQDHCVCPWRRCGHFGGESGTLPNYLQGPGLHILRDGVPPGENCSLPAQ